MDLGVMLHLTESGRNSVSIVRSNKQYQGACQNQLNYL